MASADTMGARVDELMKAYRERSRAAVEEHYPRHLETFDSVDAFVRSEFPRQAWRELYLANVPLIRQGHLVYTHGDPLGRDRDILVGINKQLADEVRHANVFTHYAREFGEEVDLASWDDTPNYQELLEQVRFSTEWDRPQDSAIGLQCSTEIMAAYLIDEMAEFIESEYPDIATTLRDVVADEGDHLHVGRLVVTRFGTVDDMDRLEEIAEEKFRRAVAPLKRLGE